MYKIRKMLPVVLHAFKGSMPGAVPGELIGGASEGVRGPTHGWQGDSRIKTDLAPAASRHTLSV